MNESKDTTTDPTYLKKIKREYYDQLHDKKFNLDDKDKFLEKYKKKKKNLSSIFMNEMGFVIKSLPTKPQDKGKPQIRISVQ